MITWIWFLEYIYMAQDSTLEGSIGDGGEVVCRKVEHEKLKEPLKGSDFDVVQQVVS
jgi:hypothetical protein